MKKIKDFFVTNNISLESKFLLATSSGPDSMALLDMMRRLVKNPSDQLIVAHVDHQLRSDSFLESKILREYCFKNDLSLQEKKWPKKDHPKQGIEASARRFRYGFFKEIMEQENIPYLLTAHHGDDLTENILLKLIRSGNAQEMNSLQEIGNFHGKRIVRPLLSFSKAELLEYVQGHQISYTQDKTNFEDDTLRNRLRHQVVPILKKENPDLVKNALAFQKSQTELQESQDTLFQKIKWPQKKLGALTGNLADLDPLPLTQKKLFFEWIIFKYWHQRVHFKNWNKETKQYAKDGFTLIFYQKKYYLFKTSLIEQKSELMHSINLDKGFIFYNKEYKILLTKNKHKLVGSFYGPANLSLKVGSIFPGARLELANGKMSKAKKKFAENAIPNELRKLCLTIVGETENQTKIYFVENCYQNQIYDANYCKYYVYDNSEE